MIVTLGDTITTPRCGRKNPAICRTVVQIFAESFQYRVWHSRLRRFEYFTIQNDKASLVFSPFVQRQGVQLKKLLKEKAQRLAAKEQKQKFKIMAENL